MKELKIFCAAALLFALSIVGNCAHAQTQALKSFGYLSSSCTTVSGAPLLTFGGGTAWQMGNGSGMAAPGSNSFPTGNFWIRGIAVTLLGGGTNNSVVIGHSGPNGDLISRFFNAPHDGQTIMFPADTAPLFTAGEYLDAHVGSCDGLVNAAIIVFYVSDP